MPVSSSEEEGYCTVKSQELQPDQDTSDHELPANPMVNYSDVKVPANEVNRCTKLPVHVELSLGPFLSTSCLLKQPL